MVLNYPESVHIFSQKNLSSVGADQMLVNLNIYVFYQCCQMQNAVKILLLISV